MSDEDWKGPPKEEMFWLEISMHNLEQRMVMFDVIKTAKETPGAEAFRIVGEGIDNTTITRLTKCIESAKKFGADPTFYEFQLEQFKKR